MTDLCLSLFYLRVALPYLLLQTTDLVYQHLLLLNLLTDNLNFFNLVIIRTIILNLKSLQLYVAIGLFLEPLFIPKFEHSILGHRVVKKWRQPLLQTDDRVTHLSPLSLREEQYLVGTLDESLPFGPFL